MKILLINPPKLHMIRTNVPEFVDEETGLYPPLGLLYVASYVQKYTLHEIEVLDAQVEKMSYDNIKKEVEIRKPDIVGIQTMTFTLIDSILTATVVKEVSKQIHVCLGGPHANIYPNETISNPYVDSLVLGEGEYVFVDVIEAIEKKKDLSQIAGVVYKDNGSIINTGSRGFIEKLDEIPFPARNLTPFKKYYSILAKRSPITTIMSSRGCPYKCLFCDRPHLGKAFRARSAENIVDEMQECIDMGIKEFFFYDDTFGVNRQRVLDVCNEILRRGLDIGWDIRTRVDNVDEELLKKLKKAGCERIHYGVESGNVETLKVLRKGITLEQVENTFKMTKEVGINSLAYFMIGSPRETKAQILETIEFARKLRPTFVHFSVTTPFPATPLYFMGLEERQFRTDYWKKFAENPSGDFIPELWEEKLSRSELLELLNYAYKSFYASPAYIIKGIFSIKSFSDLRRRFRLALRLFKL